MVPCRWGIPDFPSPVAGKLRSHRKRVTSHELPSFQRLIRPPGTAWLEVNESPGADHCNEPVSRDGRGILGALRLVTHPRGTPGWLLCCPPRRQGLAETPFTPAFRLCASLGPHSGRGTSARGVQNPAGPLAHSWTLHAPGGASTAWGVSCSRGCMWRSRDGPCVISTPPPLAFHGQRAPKTCGNSILP